MKSTLLFLFSLSMLIIQTQIAPAGTVVIAVSGDPTPSGDGTFTEFLTSALFDDAPVLNDAGQVAFSAEFTGTITDEGIFRGDATTMVEIARRGDPAPDGNGSIFSRQYPLINESGQVAFEATATGIPGVIDDAGIYRGAGSGLTQIVREGNAAPGGSAGLERPQLRGLNESGQIAFRANLIGDTSDNDWDGVFRGDGTTLTKIAVLGDAPPEGDGVYSDFDAVLINDSGHVGFTAEVTGGSTGFNRGVYRGDGTAMTKIVRTGDTAPDGNGSFGASSRAEAINASGQVVFSGGLTGTSGGSADNFGVFLGDGSTMLQIAREGDPTPDGNGSFTQLLGGFAVNDSGQVLFGASLAGTAGGTSDDEGLFLGDGTSVVPIAREGDFIPGVGGLRDAGRLSLNNAGQVALQIHDAIMLYDPTLGLVPVVRDGDPLLGGMVTGMVLAGGNRIGDEASGLNELGQVAYYFELRDGRKGIAVWTIPEPTSLLLVLLGTASMAMCRFRG